MRRLPLPVIPLLLSVLCSPLAAQELQPVPVAQGYVTDLVGLLDPAERAALDQKLRDYETKRGSQIVVLIVQTTAPEPIEDFSMRVAEKWKVGRKKVDDGVIFTVAVKDRRARIEVGYGLEGPLPDARAKQILEDRVFPSFRKGNYGEGIQAGVDSILKAVDGEAATGNLDARKGQTAPFWDRETFGLPRFTFVLGIVAIVGLLIRFILDQAMGVILGHGLTGTATGFIAFLFAWLGMGEAAGVAIFYGFGLFLFILLFGSWVFSLLSIMSDSGGSGGGGGGFSGGGGSFGGGGASGGW